MGARSSVLMLTKRTTYSLNLLPIAHEREEFNTARTNFILYGIYVMRLFQKVLSRNLKFLIHKKKKKKKKKKCTVKSKN